MIKGTLLLNGFITNPTFKSIYITSSVRLGRNYCAFAFLARSHGTIHDLAKNLAKTQISSTVTALFIIKN